ncbi:WhiB family transcriptional regulator [Nonomuraea sp. NPDC059194]|uniref:WhiB family transcriptional regulator n=1 Tax=Nonomuraea sp. NPDC059194 TaxID=3346764 RepID=UPI0036C048B9
MTRKFNRVNRPVHPSVKAPWRVQGETLLPECVYDPELHTGPIDTIESAEQRAAREEVARDVCASCPARQLCELYALRVRPTSGIWAGRATAELAEYRAEVA